LGYSFFDSQNYRIIQGMEGMTEEKPEILDGSSFVITSNQYTFSQDGIQVEWRYLLPREAN
jgi:hypothetical protein